MLSYPSNGCVDGIRGDHILLAPPYTVTDDELVTIVDTVKKCLNNQLGKLKS